MLEPKPDWERAGTQLGPGGRNFILWCQRRAPDGMGWPRVPNRKKEFVDYFWHLWINVVQPSSVFALKVPPPVPGRSAGCPTPVHTYTLAYHTEVAELAQINHAYESLVLEVIRCKATGKAIITGLMTLMEAVEKAKVPVLLRAAQAVLNNDPSTHVAIAVQFRSTLAALVEGLAPYGVVQLHGGMNDGDRADSLAAFQAHKAVAYDERDVGPRVMCLTLGVGAAGIDLDDQHGDNPRVLFVSPNYSALQVSQVCGRVARHTTKSPVTVVVACTKGLDVRVLALAPGDKAEGATQPGSETAIMAALHTKADVMSAAVEGALGVSTASTHPGNFPALAQVEDDTDPRAFRVAGVFALPL